MACSSHIHNIDMLMRGGKGLGFNLIPAGMQLGLHWLTLGVLNTTSG